MNDDQLSKSLVKIELGENLFQTGFLFTSFGHILTVGHGFDNLATPKSVKLYFEHDGDGYIFVANSQHQNINIIAAKLPIGAV